MESSRRKNTIFLHRIRASPPTVTGSRQTVRYRQLVFEWADLAVELEQFLSRSSTKHCSLASGS